MVLERIANPWSCIRLVGSTPALCVLPTCPSGKVSGLENRLSEMACGFESYRWRYLKEVFMGEEILNIREAVQKEVERAVSSNMAIKDSGNRREFETGAVRDMAEGKGDMVSLPNNAILRLSRHYEGGAKKYGRWNYTKGIPVS